MLLTMIGTAMAVLTQPFSGWNEVKRNSPDIIIARCSRTPDPYRDRGAGPDSALVYSDIEIASIVKGATNWGAVPLKAPSLGAARMCSEYYPSQGEYYLIFSIYHDGEYQASEDYRVIPLGRTFFTNNLAGQTVDEQIQTLFHLRLRILNGQMKKEQEEKQRLEEAFKK